MTDDERMKILERLARGEINAARADELLEQLEGAGAPPEGEAGGKAAAFTHATQWSPAAPIRELRIENVSGDVTARAGSETVVVATLRADAGADADARKLFEKINLTFDERDGVAVAKAGFARRVRDLFRGVRVGVDFDVTMPAAATLAVSCGTGAVTSQGVAGLRVHAGNGRVETDAANVDVDLGNGRVASRAPAELAVNGGNVAVDIRAAEGLRKFRFNAGNGRVKLAARRLAADADYAVNVASGKLELELGRRPTDCVMEIESLAGTLDTDVPFNREGRRMTYAAGEPKARLSVHAANSKVIVRVKEEG